MTETIGNAHFCEKVKHKNINRRIEWVHYFLPLLALDNFASQIYFTSGDHFMLQSLNGIEKSHGNIIALYCRNSQMQNKMRLLE